jgi:hypothetical protein
VDAKPILNQWLLEDDYVLFGQTLANAYLACDNLMRSSIVLSNFAPGIEHRSDLLGIFVQHALSKVPELAQGFASSLDLNAARNCCHLRLYKQRGFVLTAHFVGTTNFRSVARKAENRAILASANYDLFENEAIRPDVSDDLSHVYCHLLHGGTVKAAHGTLAIPRRDQEGYVASTPLAIPSPQRAQTEEIKEEMAFKILTENHGSESEEVG